MKSLQEENEKRKAENRSLKEKEIAFLRREAELVEKLRHEGALTVSLVAELADGVIGQVAFSPAQSQDTSQQWYTLGPLAVFPVHQRLGIGSQLVEAGLQALEQLGAAGCILVGNPAFYTRFGFRLAPEQAAPGVPKEYFMLRPFGNQIPSGPIIFHPVFGGD